MAHQKSPWNLHLLTILLILLVVKCSVVESRKIIEATHHKIHDDSEMIFFTINDLKIGNKIPIYFPSPSKTKPNSLLSRAEAESIPFSSKSLPEILSLIGFAPSSPQADAMAYTLEACEAEPIKGETKLCATSFESMLDFARAVFGPDHKARFTAVRTEINMQIHSKNGLTNYTVLAGPERLWAPQMVACHVMPYPYAVYYCHCQAGGSESRQVYRVSLADESGDVAVDAVAVCHVNTSHWSRDHASFRVLGIEPGSAPVCHFFPADNLVWVPERRTDNEIKI